MLCLTIYHYQYRSSGRKFCEVRLTSRVRRVLDVRSCSSVGYFGSSLRWCLVLFSPHLGSPCGIFHEMTTLALTSTFFFAWIGAILSSCRSLSPRISDLISCPVNYVPLLTCYSSFLESMEISK